MSSIARELRQALAELELVSQAPVQNLESSGRDMGEDIGGRRPAGGIDRADDREFDWRLKSVDHYRRRIGRARSQYVLGKILMEVRATLEAWRRQPAPHSKEHPMPGDYNWKRWVAESTLPDVEIARKCSVSRQYVSKIRSQYREAHAA